MSLTVKRFGRPMFETGRDADASVSVDPQLSASESAQSPNLNTPSTDV